MTAIVYLVLAVAAFIALTAAIVAAAPYLAILIIVIGCLVWLYWDDDFKEPN